MIRFPFTQVKFQSKNKYAQIQSWITNPDHHRQFGEIFGEKGLCPDHGAEVMEVKSQWEVRIGGCLSSKSGLRSVGMQIMVALWWAVVEG